MKMRMDGEKIMVRCSLCGKEAQMGPHVYEIRNVEDWGIQACDECVKSNWDGLLPERNSELISHLNSKAVPIKLNANGWLDWPDGVLLPGDIPAKRRS
jgi:hypothetical protein